MKTQCEVCNKSTLSLLLLRPSPIAKSKELKALKSDAVISDAADTQGLLPGKLPTESRFALRLLRAGYVHVYMETPPPGVKNWQVFRVTDSADLIPQSTPWFAYTGGKDSCSKDGKDACTTKGHNDAGIKLLNIPQAHLVKEIWIAYSANLWNDTLRNKNKANPEAMQKISLAGGSPNTFKPTAENLKTKVLECALDTLVVNRSNQHDFPFTSQAQSLNKLADNLKNAAAHHPKTKDKELAVVLRDPVGITTELNALRLHRNELAQAAIQKELAKPENQHALNSSNALMGLKTLIGNVEHAKALDYYAPVTSRREYTAPQAATPFLGVHLAMARKSSYEKGEWEALPNERSTRDAPPDRNALGRIWYPKSIDETLAKSKSAFQKAWDDLEDEYSESARKQWHKDFDERMRVEHLVELERYERDWWFSRLDGSFYRYFAMHFDENDPNKPTALHCPGLIYAAEANRAMTPEPRTSGDVLTHYLTELKADPAQPSAIMLRSLVGNQAAVIAKMREAISLWAVAEETHDKRNDKLYDLGAALVMKTTGPALAKYSWLSPAMGNAMSAYALVTVCALSAAGSAAVAVGTALATGIEAVRVNVLGLVQRTMDLALSSIFKKKSLIVPVVVTMHFHAGVGMHLLTHGELLRHYKGMMRTGAMSVMLHIDTDNLRELVKELKNPLYASQEQVTYSNKHGTAVIISHAALSAQITMTDDVFAKLYADKGRKWGDLLNKVKNAYTKVDPHSAVLHSLEGRLALGVILLNSYGAIKAVNEITDPKLRKIAGIEAWLSLTDGVSSVAAAVLQLHEYIVKSKHQAQLGTAAGAAALEKTASVHLRRVFMHSLGAVAGVANTWGAFIKAGKAKDEGFTATFNLHLTSGISFIAMTGVFILQAGGAFADYLLAKQVGNAVLRAAAARVALRYGAASGLGLTGWGTALLGLAVLFEVGAILLTPSEMEKWVSRSRFGTSGKKKYQSWDEEEKALLALFAEPKAESKSKPEPITSEMAPAPDGYDAYSS